MSTTMRATHPNRLIIAIFILAALLGAYFSLSASRSGALPPVAAPAEEPNSLHARQLEKKIASLLEKIDKNQLDLDNFRQEINTKLASLRALEHEKRDSNTAPLTPSNSHRINEYASTPDTIQLQVESFYAETEDPDWATEAEQNIENGLDGLREKVHFDILSNECRSNFCKTSLQFSSQEKLLEHGNIFAETSIPAMNCVQSFYMAPEQDNSANHLAELILDCTQQNQALVQSYH